MAYPAFACLPVAWCLLSGAAAALAEQALDEQRKPQTPLVFESDDNKRKRLEFAAKINPWFVPPPVKEKKAAPHKKHQGGLESEEVERRHKQIAAQLNPFHGLPERAAVQLHSTAVANQAVEDAKRQLQKEMAEMQAAQARLRTAEQTRDTATAEWKALRGQKDFGDALRLLSGFFGHADNRRSKKISEFLLKVADNKVPLESEVAGLIKELTWVDGTQFRSALGHVMQLYNDRSPLESNKMKRKLQEFAQSVNPDHDPHDKLDATDHAGPMQKWKARWANSAHKLRERNFLKFNKNFGTDRRHLTNLTYDTHPAPEKRKMRFHPFSPGIATPLDYGFPAINRHGVTGNPLIWSISVIYGGLTIFVVVLYQLLSDTGLPAKKGFRDVPLDG